MPRYIIATGRGREIGETYKKSIARKKANKYLVHHPYVQVYKKISSVKGGGKRHGKKMPRKVTLY